MQLPVIEPAFDARNIPIVFACDANYALFTGVAVRNILNLANPGRNYDVIILELGLDEAMRAELAELAAGFDNVSLRFFDLSAEMAAYKFETVPIAKRFTREVFFPLLIPPLCRKYDKVISLDPDILLLEDVAHLYDVDLGDNLAGAVMDYECTIDALLKNPREMKNRAYIMEDLGVDPFHFVNSGVVVFNIRQLAGENRLDAFLQALPMVRWLPDQDILNYVCKGRMKILDMCWNVQAFAYARKSYEALPEDAKAIFEKARANARLIHYTFVIKPWFHPGCGDWWAICRQTPFHDRILNGFMLNESINPLKVTNARPQRKITVRPPAGAAAAAGQGSTTADANASSTEESE